MPARNLLCELFRRSAMVDWNLWLLVNTPSLEFDFGDGVPLHPTVYWQVYNKLIFQYTPSDLLPPDNAILISDEQSTFLEYTSMRCWVKEWLDYFYQWLVRHWGWEQPLDCSDCSGGARISRFCFEKLIDLPVVQTDWKLSNKEVIPIRHSLLLKIKWKISKLSPLRELSPGRSCEQLPTKIWCFSCRSVDISNFSVVPFGT